MRVFLFYHQREKTDKSPRSKMAVGLERKTDKEKRMKKLFLHGLGQTAASWDKTAAAAGVSTDALCPELLSWLPKGEADYGTLYRALEAYGASVEGPFDLCGLSLGGVLALQYGIEHPNKLRSLVLIGTQYTMPRRLLQLQNMLFHLMPQRAFRSLGLERSAFIQLSRSMMELDFQDQLCQISCPVLVLCGEKDKPNRAAAAGLERLLPQARLELVPGAGHEVNRDCPEQLGQRLAAFWQEVTVAAK